jgi:hypothetical protein
MWVLPGQVTGDRAGDDVQLRRRLVLLARAAAVAAAVTLAAGFLPGVRGGNSAGSPAAAGDVLTAAAGSVSASPASPPVRLTATGTGSSPVAWQVRRTGDRAKDAAIAAFEVYFGTTVRLAEEPDPADPALPRVAVEPELGRLRRSLSVTSDAQVSQRGRVLIVARVDGLRGNQAVVLGCANWAAQRRYDGAGRPAAWRAGLTAMSALLRRDGGQWRVYLVNRLPVSRCRR